MDHTSSSTSPSTPVRTPSQCGSPIITITLVIAATYLLYIALVSLSSRLPTHDEPAYLATVSSLHAHGFSEEFLREPEVHAGPLYTVVQYLAEPLTHLRVPGIRLVNVAILALLAGVLMVTLRVMRAPCPALLGLSVICMPGMGSAACLALTELPAMLCASLSLLFLFQSLTCISHHPDEQYRLASKTGLAMLCASAGGVLFGFAILGRQTCLVALLALPILRWSGTRHVTSVLLAYLFGALLIALPVFLVWKGLVPPKTAHLDKGIAIQHGLLAMGYAAVAVWIVAPGYFSLPWKWMSAVFLSGVVLNLLTGMVHVSPLRTIAERLPSPFLAAAYSRTSSSLLAGVAAVLGVATLMNLWNRRKNPLLLFCLLAAFAIIGSAVKVTHSFGSRYVVVSFPFLLLALAQFSRPTHGLAFRLALGGLINLLSAWSYLFA